MIVKHKICILAFGKQPSNLLESLFIGINLPGVEIVNMEVDAPNIWLLAKEQFQMILPIIESDDSENIRFLNELQNLAEKANVYTLSCCILNNSTIGKTLKTHSYMIGTFNKVFNFLSSLMLAIYLPNRLEIDISDIQTMRGRIWSTSSLEDLREIHNSYKVSVVMLILNNMSDCNKLHAIDQVYELCDGEIQTIMSCFEIDTVHIGVHAMLAAEEYLPLEFECNQLPILPSDTNPFSRPEITMLNVENGFESDISDFTTDLRAIKCYISDLTGDILIPKWVQDFLSPDGTLCDLIIDAEYKALCIFPTGNFMALFQASVPAILTLVADNKIACNKKVLHQVGLSHINTVYLIPSASHFKISATPILQTSDNLTVDLI